MLMIIFDSMFFEAVKEPGVSFLSLLYLLLWKLKWIQSQKCQFGFKTEEIIAYPD